MGLGLQIWDESGTQVLDSSWRMGRVLGQLTGITSNGSQNIPDLSQGAPWGLAYQTSIPSSPAVGAFVTFNGTTMSWAFDSAAGSSPFPTTIVYGVY
ncbi:hypothetical protein GCM10011408_28050 [Dyella caseinilytica]|nr:hypothetical protein GCM10011408_28050 [Dyella caseinilytica]